MQQAKVSEKAPLYRSGDFERVSGVPDKEGDGRDPFRRDLARLIHSPAFRRLQGKTQLFPGIENDFFRNRLTHSLEVSQIATGIAINLNKFNPVFENEKINEHLVQFAALAHDLGHPPFGHNGEKELDEWMIEYGGFEGNAQTLRILSKLEKKETMNFPSGDGGIPLVLSEKKEDQRLGLNLTYRSLASIIKYDFCIPPDKEDSKGLKRPIKGYYFEESGLVEKIKEKVAPDFKGKFKTLECSIMDLADDIAYSSFDLEDSFKAGFLSPLAMSSASADFKSEIVKEINEKLHTEYPEQFEANKMKLEEVDSVLQSVFYTLWTDNKNESSFKISNEIYSTSQLLSKTGYLRVDLFSKIVKLFIGGIDFQRNEQYPALSKVKFNIPTFKMVEVLKKYSYKSIIMSPHLKISESRGRDMVNKIFEKLRDSEDGRRYLPDDWRDIYMNSTNLGENSKRWKNRTISDFVCSMTDRYCLEYYNRLFGSNPASIYKPPY